MIQNYKIIIGFSINELSWLVRKEMSSGWQPFGGVAVDARQEYFLQAVVQYEPVLEPGK